MHEQIPSTISPSQNVQLKMSITPMILRLNRTSRIRNS